MQRDFRASLRAHRSGATVRDLRRSQEGPPSLPQTRPRPRVVTTQKTRGVDVRPVLPDAPLSGFSRPDVETSKELERKRREEMYGVIRAGVEEQRRMNRVISSEQQKAERLRTGGQEDEDEEEEEEEAEETEEVEEQNNEWRVVYYQEEQEDEEGGASEEGGTQEIEYPPDSYQDLMSRMRSLSTRSLSSFLTETKQSNAELRRKMQQTIAERKRAEEEARTRGATESYVTPRLYEDDPQRVLEMRETARSPKGSPRISSSSQKKRIEDLIRRRREKSLNPRRTTANSAATLAEVMASETWDRFEETPARRSSLSGEIGEFIIAEEGAEPVRRRRLRKGAS